MMVGADFLFWWFFRKRHVDGRFEITIFNWLLLFHWCFLSNGSLENMANVLNVFIDLP